MLGTHRAICEGMNSSKYKTVDCNGVMYEQHLEKARGVVRDSIGCSAGQRLLVGRLRYSPRRWSWAIRFAYHTPVVPLDLDGVVFDCAVSLDIPAGPALPDHMRYPRMV